MPDTLDEAVLLKQIALGDQPAFERLAAAYHPRLWRYLARHLDPGTVEEVLQDIYLAIWRAAGSFRGTARPSTWIFQIAHHHMVDSYRTSGRHEEHLDRFAEEDQQTTPSPEQAITDRVDLAAALRFLSPRHLETLDLVYFHGFTIAETARILDVPPGTVKSRLSHAREQLHIVLEQGAFS